MNRLLVFLKLTNLQNLTERKGVPKIFPGKIGTASQFLHISINPDSIQLNLKSSEMEGEKKKQ